METILGLYILYAIGHFFVIQHTTVYQNRSQWDKIVTWSAIVGVILLIISIIS